MSDGDTITAALFNNEYNQLVNAFAYHSSTVGSTGHRHDGTAGHGGNIHTIGDLDFLNKIVADSTNNRWGVFVEVSSAAVEQIRISDGVISPVTDNDIDLGTSSLEFKDLFIDGTAHIDTLDVDVNGTVAGTFGVTGATTLSSTLAVTGAVTGSSTIQGTTITATTAFVPDASDGAALGTSALEFSDLFLADGAVINFGDDQDITLTHTADTGLTTNGTFQATTITATTAFVPDASDGAALGTSALEFSDLFLADGAVINFGDDQDVSLTHVADTGLLISSTDQLQFGDSGTYIYQSADGVLDLVSDTEIELTATTIDINGAVAMDGAITGGTNITISGELDAATLDISGNADIDGTLEADAITVDGTALATYIRDTVGTNMLSSNTESGITVTYDTSNDNIDFAVDAAQTGITSIYATDLILGEDSQTAIDFGTANEIDFKADNAARLTLTSSALYPVTDNEIDLGTSSLEFKDAYFDGTVTSDAFAGPLTGDVTGTADLATSVTVSANNSTDETVYPLFVDGATGTQGAETDTGFTYNPSSGLLTIAGELDAGSLDVSGDADIDGTLEADAITVDGTALNEYIADTVGAMVGSNTESGITVAYQDGDNTLDFTVGTLNQDTTGTAAIATTVTITDNESTNESNAIVFTAGGDVDGGNLGLESDGTLTYNPSSGLVTATSFAGQVTTAAQTNITSLLATDIKIGEDDQTKIDFETADEIHLYAANVEQVYVADNIFGPQSDSDVDLGTTGVRWKDAYVDSITVTGEVDGASLDISGDADIDGTLETDALTINGSALNYKAFGTSSIMLGDSTTGTISNANYNTGVGVDVFAAITTGDNNVAVGFSALNDNTTASGNTAVGYGAGDAITTGNTNTAFGVDALGVNITGVENTAIGAYTLAAHLVDATIAIGTQALNANTTGTHNTALGYNALLLNTTGGSNTAIGKATLDANTTASYGTAVGYGALSANTTGASNTAVGYFSMLSNTTGATNTAVGEGALYSNTTASSNTAVGSSALLDNTTGALNVAVGKDALANNTTGSQSIGIGSGALFTATTGDDNIAIGRLALRYTTTASDNVAIGTIAMQDNTTGAENVAIGYGSMGANTTGSDNVAIGFEALDANTTGVYNTAIGVTALGANTTANSNTAIGRHAMAANTTGTANVSVGYGALAANTTANDNTALGYNALAANTTGSQLTAVGLSALDANTTGVANVGVGYHSLSGNTTASYNVGVGYTSLYANTTGAYNIAVGHQAMESNTTGSSSTCMGYQAGLANLAGTENTFVGYLSGRYTGGADHPDYNTGIGSRALYANTTGETNVAVGAYALAANTTASRNVGLGYNAGGSFTTGAHNTAVGYACLDGSDDGDYNCAVGNLSLSANCGDGNVVMGYVAATDCTGDHNTVLGYAAGNALTSGDNNLLLGKEAGHANSPGGAVTTGGSYVILGDENIGAAHIQVDWTIASDERDKTDFTALDVGLNFINALEPLTYKWDKRSNYVDWETNPDTDLNSITHDGTHKEDWLDIGFKAQDIVALEVAAGYKIADKTNLTTGITGDGKKYGIQYSKFIPILVKALQEADDKIDALTTRIEALEA